MRLLAIDLDGTLLNTRREITSVTFKAVSTVAYHGVHVVLVSARMPRSVAFYRDRLRLTDPLIACSGSLILCGRELTHLGDISAVAAREVLRMASAYRDVHVSIYTGDEWYVSAFDSVAEEESSALGIMPRVVADLGSLAEPPTKITAIGVLDVLMHLADQIRQHVREVYCVFSRPTDLEILKVGVSKGNALQEVCLRLGVSREEVAAIGDQMNDEDMLRFAGVAVAMGNSPDELKKLAALVVPSNDEEGVAFALKCLYPFLQDLS